MATRKTKERKGLYGNLMLYGRPGIFFLFFFLVLFFCLNVSLLLTPFSPFFFSFSFISGTGKTLWAEKLAREAKMDFAVMSGPSFDQFEKGFFFF